MLTAAGFEGVFPFDAALAREGISKRVQAERIFAANTALMRSCDAMIANLTPFRGVSADAGNGLRSWFHARPGTAGVGLHQRRGELPRPRHGLPRAAIDA